MSFQTYPFIKFLFYLLLGRLLGNQIGWSSHFYIPLIIGFLSLMLFYVRPNILSYGSRHWIGIIVSFLFVFIGIVTSPDRQKEVLSCDKPLIFSAVATKVLKNSGGQQSVLFNCITVDSLRSQSFNAIAYFKCDIIGKRVLPGDKLIVNTRINPFKETGNPFSFEYSKYMASKGVFYSFYINKPNFIIVDSEYNYRRYFYKLREAAESRLKLLRLSPDEYAIISALLLGNKDHLDYDQKQAFSDSGAMHILAVSGLHLGVIFMLVTSVLGKITRSRLGVLKVIITVSILWLYASVSGLSPSIVRASIMLTIFLISKLVSNKYNVYHTLAIAAFIILVGNPYALFNVGFWLSFLAVGSIIYFFPLINALLFFRKPWNKLVWDIVSVSLAAQIGTILLGVFTFKFFPLWFLVSNLLMLPVLPVILLSALLIVLTPEGGFVAHLFSGILKDGLWYINEITNCVSDLPNARFTLVQIGFYEMLVLYCILLSVVLWSHTKRLIYLNSCLLLLVLFMAFSVADYWQKGKRNLLVVANVKGSSLIFESDGKNGYVILNDTLEDRIINQVVNPMKLHEGLDSLIYVVSESDVLMPFQTSDKRILRLNGECNNIANCLARFKTDIVIITSKTPLSTIQHLTQLKNIQLIFDSSWSARGLRNIKKMKNNSIPYFANDGAYILVDQL